MSASDRPGPGNTETTSPAQEIPTLAQEDAPSSTSVEVNRLQTDRRDGSPLEQSETHKSLNSAEMPHPTMRTDTTTAIHNAQNPPAPSVPTIPSTHREPAQSTAIGESTESPTPITKDTEHAGPTLTITLLLITGARHPFNLDAKYLAKRNVQVQGNDPFNLSVYKVKELILREWRDDWESKPSSPSAIRLISFGKVLDDKAAVKGICGIIELQVLN